MLSVTKRPFTLSVIMRNVVILNVVAPKSWLCIEGEAGVYHLRIHEKLRNIKWLKLCNSVNILIKFEVD
jgi:hypothetical protein